MRPWSSRCIFPLIAGMSAISAFPVMLEAGITDGLVAHYRFDETSGDVAADAVRGGAGQALVAGGAAWVAGRIGGAIELDGIDDWLAALDPIPDGAGAISFSGWVWADARSPWGSIVKNWGSSQAGQFHCGLHSTAGDLSNFLTDSTNVREGTVFPMMEWQHVAFTFDGAVHRLYRNGALVDTQPTTTKLRRNHPTLSMGVKTANDGIEPDAANPGWWSGMFDDFGVWDRALDADEVARIHEAGLVGRSLADAEAPVVLSFVADPPVAAAGTPIVLQWNVEGADELTLEGGALGLRDVSDLDSLLLEEGIQESTTFALTATNGLGSVTVQVAVAVGQSSGGPILNEVLAMNSGGLRDEDGDASDWIEIHNPSDTAVDLGGWFLSDEPTDLRGWQFPSATIPPGGFLIVFASGKDRAVSGSELHADFRLDGGGEFLALTHPDGTTVASAFDPGFPELGPDVSYGPLGDPPALRRLYPPTPGAANASPAGPLIVDVTENPSPQPDEDEPIAVRANVIPNGASITGVLLHYRVMFGAESTVPMRDDGLGPDPVAGDGEYSAQIPAAAFGPGEMVRWRVTASAADGIDSREPLFPDPVGSPQYFGTVATDPSIATQLPVVHRFVASPGATESRSGTRAAIFYDGEFYDNVFSRMRGGTSASWPKKSYKIEFNDGHHFRFRDGIRRVDEFNLNTTYTDKSYIRAVLSYELHRDSGQPSPETFPIHVRQNGAFFSVALFIEQVDRDFLRRHDLDPDGALYKGANSPTHYLTSTPISLWEKKTRRDEGTGDLRAFIQGIGQSGDALERFLFDHVDLPQQINYMATVAVSQNIDGSDKNHYIYRDTEGSGEWFMLPWDLDLAWGPNALNTDTMVASQNYASHPYIGARPYLLHDGKFNHLLEVIVQNPRTKAMLNRRIRTLTDRFLATARLHERIDELVAQIEPDVALDRARWGGSAHFPGRTYSLREATDRIKSEYLEPRLTYLTVTHGQPGTGAVLIDSSLTGARALVPRDGTLGTAWIDNGFDDSGWLAGGNGVGFERGLGGGYEELLGIDLLGASTPPALRIDMDGDGVNENDSVYIRYRFNLADSSAISFLKLRVKYDDGFICHLNGTEIARRNAPAVAAWNASATASHIDSAALVFEDIDVSVFRSVLRSGTNVLAVQALNQGLSNSDMLFAVELVDEAPASGGTTSVGIPRTQSPEASIEFGAIEFKPASGNQDEEFVELRNPSDLAVDVSGWRVRGGIGHDLRPGTVIAPGDSLYLSPDAAVFRARTTSPRGGEGLAVQGGYRGHLSNFGEPLVIEDEAGRVVASIVTPSEPSDVQRYLALSELDYHPADPHGDAEFIELVNQSDAGMLDLSGVRFTEGIAFEFPQGAMLPPGGFAILVYDREAFEAVHGAGHPVLGEFGPGSRLSNDGETIKLEDAGGGTVFEFSYNDAAPWATDADGGGRSLIFAGRQEAAPRREDDPDRWRPSTEPGGNPGVLDSIAWIPGTSLVDYSLAGQPVASIGDGGGLELRVPLRWGADDARLFPEWSSGLDEWRRDGIEPLGVFIVGGQLERRWRMPSTASPAAGFMRVVIEVP